LADRTSLLGSEVLSLLPPLVRECVTEPHWWRIVETSIVPANALVMTNC